MIWPPSTRSEARNAVAASFRLSPSPSFTDRSLRLRLGSYYFVLRERPFGPAFCGPGGSIPGDVLAGLLISVAAQVPHCRTFPSRAHVCSSVLSGVGCGACVLASLFVVLAGVWTAHPAQAPAGVCSSHVHDAVRGGGCRPRRALCSPLRIPKRARASLFSKLQRANGECLGV
jgi:hypothetical protein